jgi:hypothetical protein
MNRIDIVSEILIKIDIVETSRLACTSRLFRYEIERQQHDHIERLFMCVGFRWKLNDFTGITNWSQLWKHVKTLKYKRRHRQLINRPFDVHTFDITMSYLDGDIIEFEDGNRIVQDGKLWSHCDTSAFPWPRYTSKRKDTDIFPFKPENYNFSVSRNQDGYVIDGVQRDDEFDLTHITMSAQVYNSLNIDEPDGYMTIVLTSELNVHAIDQSLRFAN